MRAIVCWMCQGFIPLTESLNRFLFISEPSLWFHVSFSQLRTLRGHHHNWDKNGWVAILISWTSESPRGSKTHSAGKRLLFQPGNCCLPFLPLLCQGLCSTLFKLLRSHLLARKEVCWPNQANNCHPKSSDTVIPSEWGLLLTSAPFPTI